MPAANHTRSERTGCSVTTSSSPALPPGTVVTGRWNKGRYQIGRLLGEGANGQVYFVKKGRSAYAMKVGFDSLDLQSEINVLKELNRSSKSTEPFLVDADDFRYAGKEHPFYVMQYVKGKKLPEFLQFYGSDWLYIVGKNLLGKLCELHAKGWVFGDLKPENIMVSDYGEVHLVDYGGVTKMGRAVKQFTEIYDRGYWNAGTRTADEAYDLFSFSVLCLQLTERRNRLLQSLEWLPQNRSADDLLGIAQTVPECRSIYPFLQKALRGQFRTSAEAYKEWNRCLMRANVALKPSARFPWLQGLLVVSAAIFAATVYFVLQ